MRLGDRLRDDVARAEVDEHRRREDARLEVGPDRDDRGREVAGADEEAGPQAEAAGDEQREERGQGHDPEPADLDQRHDHDLAGRRPVRLGVDDHEPGHADRRRRGEERGQERGPLVAGPPRTGHFLSRLRARLPMAIAWHRSFFSPSSSSSGRSPCSSARTRGSTTGAAPGPPAAPRPGSPVRRPTASVPVRRGVLLRDAKTS